MTHFEVVKIKLSLVVTQYKFLLGKTPSRIIGSNLGISEKYQIIATKFVSVSWKFVYHLRTPFTDVADDQISLFGNSTLCSFATQHIVNCYATGYT